MEFDASAAYRAWTVDVDVADTTYTIPPLPALAWLEAIDEGTWAAIVPGLIDGGTLDHAICIGAVPAGETRAAAWAALTASGGARWWIVAKLINLARRPILGGQLVLAGVDPAVVSLGAYVLACYRLATQNMNAKQLLHFDMLLGQPPPDVPEEEWWDEEEAEEAFVRSMGGEAVTDPFDAAGAG